MKRAIAFLLGLGVLAGCGDSRSTWDKEECERVVTWLGPDDRMDEPTAVIHVQERCRLRPSPQREAGPWRDEGGWMGIFWEDEPREVDSWTRWPEAKS